MASLQKFLLFKGMRMQNDSVLSPEIEGAFFLLEKNAAGMRNGLVSYLDALLNGSVR